MGRLGEQVEGAAHVELPARAHVQQREIDGAAATVAGLPRDVAPRKELLLRQLRVEIRLHTHVLILDAPEHEVLDRTGGAVGVEDLEPVALNKQLAADDLERPRRLDREQGAGLLVPVDPVADKIVGGIIADLLYDLRHVIRQQDEAGRVHGFTRIISAHRRSSLA